MLILFCSAATALYKRDALAAISYPKGHIFRFRYATKYVDQTVLDHLERDTGERGIIVFADTITTTAIAEFKFYPVRIISAIRLTHLADAIYVDFELGEFLNYGSDGKKEDVWNEYLKALGKRPWPPALKSGRKEGEEGCFLLEATGSPFEVTAREKTPYENWHTVVNHLDRSVNLGKSTFLLCLGFYQIRSNWFFWHSESELKSKNNKFHSIYPVPMGKSVVLKVLLSRPSYDYDSPESVRTLSVKYGGDAFSGISKETIGSESRYDEDRTVLVCKRVFDSALSVVSIEETGDKTARSPRLTLLTKVRVPTWVMLLVIGGVAISTLLLALDEQVLRFIALLLDDAWRSALDRNVKAIAAIGKLLAPFPIAVSAYLAFKRLPIK